MDNDTEEAQAWIEAMTHDPFDDISFLANLKTGARRGVPASPHAPASTPAARRSGCAS